MMFDLIEALYYLIPAAALVFFVVSLVRYLAAIRRNKLSPGTYSERQMKDRRLCLIISAVIAGIMAAVILAFIGLLMMAVAFM
ncbi:MAG: hypothetical protein IKL84_00595 [Clostridia bacterium]|nr:hypothetical protein [Clostridia bacterium]